MNVPSTRELNQLILCSSKLILCSSIEIKLSDWNNKIRANIVSPGFTETSYFNKFKKKKKLYNWTISRIPMGRWGKPKEVANLISFLLSDNSEYITGENINIDGGWLSSWEKEFWV